MEREVLLKNGYDLVYLTKCALRGEVPDAQMVEAMDLEAVCALAHKHSMTAVSAYAVESYSNANAAVPGAQHPAVKTWAQGKAQAIRKNLLLDMEREKILAHLEEIGCWYMPLKGVFLQHLYPRAGMRQMSDNDILIDPAFRMAVAEYMTANGYAADSIGAYIHDEYLKKPVYNFEIHVALVSELSGHWADYYRQVKDKLIKDEENENGYHFTDEDFYIYMIVHAAKHYESGGNGIRSLMDVFIYLGNKGETLDRQYIDQELSVLGVTEYEQSVAGLAEKLFCGDAELTEGERDLFLYHISSGTYGNWATKIDNGLKKLAGDKETVTFWVKVKYSLRRLFPPVEFYKVHMPLVYRYKVLIPFVAVYRIVSKMIFSAPRFWGEAKRTWGRKDQEQ